MRMQCQILMQQSYEHGGNLKGKIGCHLFEAQSYKVNKNFFLAQWSNPRSTCVHGGCSTNWANQEASNWLHNPYLTLQLSPCFSIIIISLVQRKTKGSPNGFDSARSWASWSHLMPANLFISSPHIAFCLALLHFPCFGIPPVVSTVHWLSVLCIMHPSPSSSLLILFIFFIMRKRGALTGTTMLVNVSALMTAERHLKLGRVGKETFT